MRNPERVHAQFFFGAGNVPFSFSYHCFHFFARALVDGSLKKDSKLKAGRLGDKEVRGDNVLLGGTLTFTKQNIDQFNF